MSRTRLSINDKGEFVKRDGTVVGRLVSVTVDLDESFLGTIGGGVMGLEAVEENPPSPQLESQLFEAPDPLQVVWDHYQKTVKGASRRKLDSTRKGIIRNALKVRSAEQCCQAIDGLAASPWHNGVNENRQEYLDIRYALKGNSQRGESNDARIDSMVEKAGTPHSHNGRMTVDDLLRTVPSDRHWIMRDQMSKVIHAFRVGTRDESAEAAVLATLKAEPIVTDEGKFDGWRRATVAA